MKISILAPFIKLYRRRRFWLRVLLSLIIGILVLGAEEVSNFDFRFSLRGQQQISEEIVLVTINPSDVSFFYPKQDHRLQNFAEVTDISDSFFWNQSVWEKVLKIVLEQNPKVIGMNFFFSENLIPNSFISESSQVLSHKKIFWLGGLFQNNMPMLPAMTNRDHTNVGFFEVNLDDDGKLRRFPSENLQQPSLMFLLARAANPLLTPYQKNQIINYRGDANSFRKVRFSEIMTDQISPEVFKNKIVIIGPEVTGFQFITPVGPMTKTEVLAHLTDNLTADREIHKFNSSFYWIYLLLTLLFSVFIFTSFPQGLGLTIVAFFVLLISSISIWLFDTFKIWIPVQSVAAQIASAWILIVGYMASRIERKNWQLEQDRKSRQELEQLKNNFVSLISHDLNTPIAKIQAIIDRIELNSPNAFAANEMKTLRIATHELHKYIQSILRVLRVESSEFKLNYEVTDINEIIEEVVTSLEPLALNKDIQIEKNLEPQFSVELDITLMREVFANLLENAIKYTPKGGRVMVSSTENNNRIVVAVTDNGEGISLEEQADVFGKFVRGKNQDLKSKGTGLGLYLVKYFTELHGGLVDLKSQVGVGTTVTLSLPIDQILENP